VARARYVGTKVELARRCGISYYTLSGYFKLPGHPRDHSPGSARHDVHEWREFIQAHRSAYNFGTGSNGDVPYTPNERERALIEKTHIATQREKFRLEVEMSEYVPRVEANRQIEAANAVVRRELRKALEFELPPRVEMMEAPEVRKIMAQKFREITAHLPRLIIGSLNGSGSQRP
jgi:hypothetical protein